jgi:hypothetical protein
MADRILDQVRKDRPEKRSGKYLDILQPLVKKYIGIPGIKADRKDCCIDVLPPGS